MPIRPYRESDFETLLRINSASTPGVSEESASSFRQILSVGTCLVVEDDAGLVQGFINLIEPGTLAYESPNLRWFEAWQAVEGRSLIYVDRIAFAETARGKGMGDALYRHVFKACAERSFIGAEVNTAPDNPGSHRFHRRMGFDRVGEQVFKPGEKAVAYYARSLNGR